MSQGPFVNTFYETSAENGGFVLACRVQPETLAAEISGVANTAPAGPADAPGSATISQGRRTAGVNMRYVTLNFTDAGTADGVQGPVRIPVLSPTTFAAWTRNATGTYLSRPVEVSGRVGETVR